MMTLLTTEQFKKILIDTDLIRQGDLELFQTFYSFSNHQSALSQVAKIMGHTDYNGHSRINLQVGRTAKRLAGKFKINFEQREDKSYRYWKIFFDGWAEEKLFIWQLRPNLTRALEELSLINEFQYSEELPFGSLETFSEGLKRSIIVNAYERNSIARQRCIDKFGPVCSVCNFDFSKFYGDIGNDFIHVHHLALISSIGETYEVDPINDLRPVCPNCHAMLHKQNPPLTIEELRDKIQTAASQ